MDFKSFGNPAVLDTAFREDHNQTYIGQSHKILPPRGDHQDRYPQCFDRRDSQPEGALLKFHAFFIGIS